MKNVYMNPDDWEPTEYEAEITCPYCGETNVYANDRAFFSGDVFHCFCCGKEFSVYCEN